MKNGKIIGIRLIKDKQPVTGVLYFSALTKVVIVSAVLLMILGVTTLVLAKPDYNNIQSVITE